MTKLHQILAVEAGIRNQADRDLTAAHHGLKHPDMQKGLFRSYQPNDEVMGEKLPPERTELQCRVTDVIKETVRIFEKKYDVVATRDYANMSARADVVLNDGKKLMENVPAIYLLWLEKQLNDLHTFVTQLPVLPADTEWEWSDAQRCWKNKHEIKTTRTNKVPYALQLAPATDKHPAQVVKETKDEIVGYYTTMKYSGAMPASQIKAMKERVEELQKAVKLAREKANQIDVVDQKVGGTLMKYVFGDMA